jgi:hypothetical protein
MPLTKVFTSAGTAYGTAANWQAVSVRNSAYAWTASGSGTNEYYLRTEAGADPEIVAIPASVHINGSSASSGTVGSLSAGTWGYDDNDTLGYDTLYVRLSDGSDPDSQLADYVKFFQIPQAAEHVRIPPAAGSISSDLDQSAVAIGGFYGEEGYAGTVGSATGYLRIDPDSFSWEGIGTAYIDLGAATIPISVLSTGQASTGARGLYLRGSGITVADIRGGQVGIAYLGGETSTVGTLRQTGESTDVVIGSGCGLTTVHLYGGTLRLRCSSAVTTVLQYGGKLYLEEGCAVTTLTQYGGTCEWNSSGTIGTLNGYGGTFDESKCGLARTVTTTNVYDTWTQVCNNEAVMRTNKPVIQRSLRTNYSAA